MSPPVRLLALNWSLDKPSSTIHRICGDRVLQRGDKHQSLRANKVSKSHEEVIWQFITNTEELSNAEVDVSVDMELEDTPEQALDRAIAACVRVLGVEQPSPEMVNEALEVARGYEPTVRKMEDKKKDEKGGNPRYFGLLAEIDLDEVVGNNLDASESDVTLWQHLTRKGRVAKRPHVTIVHSKSLPSETELWEQCMRLHRLSVPPLFKLRLGALVWNDRVMAVAVDDIQLETQEDNGQEGHEFVSKLPHDVRERLHITVGTQRDEVKPVEAKSLVEGWRDGKTEGVHIKNLEGVFVKGRIKGLYQ
jgi:tRNA ligase